MTTSSKSALEMLLRPLRKQISVELARALCNLRADEEVQARYDDLADRNTAGTLELTERAELESLVHANSILSALKSQARAVLEDTGTEG